MNGSAMELALGDEADDSRWTARQWRNDGVLEGLTMKREMARRWTTWRWTTRRWSSRSAMKQMARNGRLSDGAMDGLRSAMNRMACDGQLGDGAMDGSAMECLNAWWWRTGRLVDGQLNVGAIDGY